MGLIAAAKDSISSLLKDQWREYFYCESLPETVLMVKGKTRQDGSKNNKGTDNIISNGSIVAVNEGQCMIIVDQGAIVDFCAEPGEFVYDTSSEPSLLYGNLGDNLKATFSQLGRRFTMGGSTGKDQRVYFFNTKEIPNNLFGTPNPVPFRVVDNNIGLDVDISIKCNGKYSFRLTDPLLFYKNVAANVSDSYKTEQITSMMKSELIDALQPAFATISEQGVRYSAIPGHTKEMKAALNAELAEDWANKRGITLESIAFNSVKASEEDEAMIKELQKKAVYRDPGMGAANLNDAQAEAMKAAAANTSTGPMMAFAGMNMAQMAGGMNAGDLYGVAAQQQAAKAAAAAAAPAAGAKIGWKCECGTDNNTGKFCTNCGKPKPSDAGWTCSCGTVNQGKFCQNCGSPRPAGAPLYKCDKCGFEPEDPANPPKFCPQCGDPFDDNDKI
ncbi:MAG: SPFH domain-containing protein [Lachnospiraceae bacterium]|nr:SPFH domain-containing protein [Lachnospiraceae bacterium]